MTRTRNTAPRAIMLLIAAAMIAAACPAPAQPPARGETKRATAPPKAPAAGAKAPDRTRTLEAINIEGEIAVPQVLFITARDVRRYRDGLGKKFQLSAIEAGRAAVLPSRLRVADTQSQ